LGAKAITKCVSFEEVGKKLAERAVANGVNEVVLTENGLPISRVKRESFKPMVLEKEALNFNPLCPQLRRKPIRATDNRFKRKSSSRSTE